MRDTISYLSFKALYPYKNIKNLIIFRLIEPLLHYSFFTIMTLSILGSEYIEFVLVGNIVFVFSRIIILDTITIFRTERQYNTLALNLVTNTSAVALVIKRAVFPILDASFAMGISLMLVKYIFGVSVNLVNIVPIILIVMILLFSVFSISIVIASISLVFKNVNLFLNLILGIVQVICGINFPIELLPSYIRFLAYNIPITNGLVAMREIISNGDLTENYVFLMREFLIGCVFLILGLILVFIMEKLARKMGSLLN